MPTIFFALPSFAHLVWAKVQEATKNIEWTKVLGHDSSQKKTRLKCRGLRLHLQMSDHSSDHDNLAWQQN